MSHDPIRAYPYTGNAEAPMTTKATLFSFNNRSSFSVSISPQVILQFPGFGHHQRKPVVQTQVSQIVELEFHFL